MTINTPDEAFWALTGARDGKKTITKAEALRAYEILAGKVPQGMPTEAEARAQLEGLADSALAEIGPGLAHSTATIGRSGPGDSIFGRTATGEPVTAGMIKIAKDPRAVISTIAEWTEEGADVRDALGLMEWERLKAVVDADNPYKTSERKAAAPIPESDFKRKINQVRKAQGSEPLP